MWDALFPREQARILDLLVERIDYDRGEERLKIRFGLVDSERTADRTAWTAWAPPCIANS